MKKIFNYVLAISAIVIGMAFGSCNEEEFPSPSHPDGDVVPVILSVEVADLVSSRAIDENLISDIIFIFSGIKSVTISTTQKQLLLLLFKCFPALISYM